MKLDEKARKFFELSRSEFDKDTVYEEELEEALEPYGLKGYVIHPLYKRTPEVIFHEARSLVVVNDYADVVHEMAALPKAYGKEAIRRLCDAMDVECVEPTWNMFVDVSV